MGCVHKSGADGLRGVDPHVAQRAEVLDMDGFLHLVAVYNTYRPPWPCRGQR